MKKQKNKKVIYYSDPINDDFAGTKIKTTIVDENFKYIHKNFLWKACSFTIYYIIALPLVWFFCRVLLRIKIVNKKAIKKLKKQQYFMYGNHTGFYDAFIPNLISVPRFNKIIVSPDTVSIKGLKNIVQMLGAVPLPTNDSGMKNYLQAVDYFQKSKNNITVYPEAHIWPYYTGVRPFKETSFSYPIRYNAPVVAFYTAYTKPKGLFKHFRKANITVYISDPIYPDLTKDKKSAKKELRDKVYDFMKETSEKYSDYNVYEYIQTEK